MERGGARGRGREGGRGRGSREDLRVEGGGARGRLGGGMGGARGRGLESGRGRVYEQVTIHRNWLGSKWPAAIKALVDYASIILSSLVPRPERGLGTRLHFKHNRLSILVRNMLE